MNLLVGRSHSLNDRSSLSGLRMRKGKARRRSVSAKMDCSRQSGNVECELLTICGGSDHACSYLMARPTEEEWVVNDMYLYEHPKCCGNRIGYGSVHHGSLVMISYSEKMGGRKRGLSKLKTSE